MTMAVQTAVGPYGVRYVMNEKSDVANVNVIAPAVYVPTIPSRFVITG